MKKLIIFIAVLLLIGSVSSTLLLLHPPKIEFSGNTNQKICQKVSIFSDYNGNLIAKIKWSDKKDSKILNEYTINSTNLGITHDFSEKVISNNEKKDVEICLTFEKSGEYYGALLYSPEIGSAGAGIWIYANIKGENSNLDLGKITGNAIIGLKNIINKNILKNNKNQKALLVSSTTLLLFVLFMLLLFVEKRVEREYEQETKERTEIKTKISKKSSK